MLKSKSRSAVGTVSLIAIITLLSQPLGFIRSMLIASAFGTGIQMDAYNMAYSLIGILPILLISYIESTYIPEYILARNESKEEATKFYSRVLTLTLILSFAISVVCFICTPWIVVFFAPGFDESVRNLTVQILRLIIWIIPVQIAVSIWSSTLNARKVHIVPTLAGASVNLFIIPAVLFFTKFFNIWAIVGASTINLIFQGAILYTTLFRHGQPYHANIDSEDPRIRKTVKLAVPSVAASAIGQINTLVDKTILSNLPLGSVSAYSYATIISGFAYAFILTPFTTVFFSRMSERAANKDKSGSLDILWRTIEFFLAIVLPICVITTFMRTEIVRIVFERGAFGEDSTIQVGLILMFCIWSIAISTISYPLSQTFLAWQDLRGMILRGVISVAVNIASSILLSRYFGIIGVVLGTLLANLIFTLSLLITLRYRWGPLGLSRTIIEILKMSVCTVACGLFARFLRGIMPQANGTLIMDIFRFGTVTLICGGIFFGLAMLLRVRGIKEVYRIFIGVVNGIAKRIAR